MDDDLVYSEMWWERERERDSCVCLSSPWDRGSEPYYQPTQFNPICRSLPTTPCPIPNIKNIRACMRHKSKHTSFKSPARGSKVKAQRCSYLFIRQWQSQVRNGTALVMYDDVEWMHDTKGKRWGERRSLKAWGRSTLEEEEGRVVVGGQHPQVLQKGVSLHCITT